MKVKDWDLVETAVTLHNSNKEVAALLMLEQALDCSSSCNSGSCCKSNETPTPTKPTSADNIAKDYGLNGYTDENDPRDVKTARSHSPQRPHDSVHVIVHSRPERKYKLESVQAFGPTSGRGGGRTLAWVKVPNSFNGDVILGTGHQGEAGKYSNRIKHGVGQDVVITNKFSLPNLSGVVIFLQDSSGKIVSDEVANLGNPDGDHFSYELIFVER